MAKTYEPIQTTTLSSAQATVTFSSIPQTYTDLFIVFQGTSPASADFRIRVGNGSLDTGSNYSRTFMYGDGSSAGAGRDANTTYWTSTSYTSVGNVLFNISNYSDTSTFKTMLNRYGGAGFLVYAGINLWRSTAIIDTISFFHLVQTFSAGSSFTLYGIKEA